MKSLLLVPDGAADEPLDELDGKTPLMVAKTPNLDRLSETGLVGAVEVTPPEMYPGSDAANMALLGYDPKKHYTGRGPVEAAAMGIPMEPKDVAFRCSLITTDGETLIDYSAGHIATEDARELVMLANEKLGTRAMTLFPGVSYRHILRWSDGPVDVLTHPPHENMSKKLADIYPVGDGDSKIKKFIEDSLNLLDDHPYNRRMRAEGKPVANTLWLWSPGRAPILTPFFQKHGITGAVIAAVDVVRGLGVLAGLEIVNVPGATGYFDTNYKGKALYAVNALDRHDFVWIHVEAPDEAGHLGSIEEKIRAIERFDGEVVGTLLDKLQDVPFRLLCAPDHATPIAKRGHAIAPVPYLLYDSRKPMRGTNRFPFDERAVWESKSVLHDGYRLMDSLLAE